MACSMKSITTNAIVLIIIIRNSIHIGVFRHGLMESCIKDTHLRQTRHKFCYSGYALKVCRIMKWCEVVAGSEVLQHLFVKKYAFIKLLTSMDHTVTDSIDLLQILDGSNLFVNKYREDKFDTFSVLRNIVHNLLFISIWQFNHDKRTFQADTLDTPSCHNRTVGHVVELVLDGRATTV